MSRYNQMGLVEVEQFETNAIEGETPVRVDTVTARRYTTWEDDDSRTYVVPAGDTFMTIANREYGDHSLGWLLADFNPEIKYPLDLAKGDVIRIPSVDYATALAGM